MTATGDSQAGQAHRLMTRILSRPLFDPDRRGEQSALPSQTFSSDFPPRRETNECQYCKRHVWIIVANWLATCQALHERLAEVGDVVVTASSDRCLFCRPVRLKLATSRDRGNSYAV